MLRHLLPLGLFIVLVVFLSAGLIVANKILPSTLIDKPAPNFSLPQLSNTTSILSERDFIGKVSLFNVWASWCLTCRYEHPLLMQLAKEGYTIYGLNYRDTLAKAKEVLAQTGNPYVANGFDEKGLVGIDWGVTGTPETFVIDKQGIVRYKHVGQLTLEQWNQKIKLLIQELEKS